MSKHNKVNPGLYTQAGRLSQDDAAREMKKQREVGSPKQTEGGQFGERVKARVTDKDNQQDDDAAEEDETIEDEAADQTEE